MTKYSLRCPQCAKECTPEPEGFGCPDCDAPTVVRMNLDESAFSPRPGVSSMWRYFDLLPVEEEQWITTQGEGWTPLVEATALAERFGIGEILLKNETVNPTGAFKDRQVSVGISKAREAGASTVAVVSSGNVAASASSYAALAGIHCKVFTPANAPEDRLIQARIYGAAHYKVDTCSSSRLFELVVGACREQGWHLLSTAGLYNPFQVEGAKTIAHELYEQTETLPDLVIVPVGGGGLLGALWRGFEELKRLGRIEGTPALVGVQASACTPLVQALEKGLSPAEVIANPVDVGVTIAGAIADDILFDAYTALPAIRETGGAAVAVTDAEMLSAQKRLAREAGLFAEPASAATIAGLAKLRESNRIGASDRVCCVITGSGFKDIDAARGNVDPPVVIEPTETAFKALSRD